MSILPHTLRLIWRRTWLIGIISLLMFQIPWMTMTMMMRINRTTMISQVKMASLKSKNRRRRVRSMSRMRRKNRRNDWESDRFLVSTFWSLLMKHYKNLKTVTFSINAIHKPAKNITASVKTQRAWYSPQSKLFSSRIHSWIKWISLPNGKQIFKFGSKTQSNQIAGGKVSEMAVGSIVSFGVGPKIV
mgnify:CR=1 FL=1